MLTAFSYVIDRVIDDESTAKAKNKNDILASAGFSVAVLGAVYLVGILFWGLGRMNGTW